MDESGVRKNPGDRKWRPSRAKGLRCLRLRDVRLVAPSSEASDRGDSICVSVAEDKYFLPYYDGINC